MQFLWLFWSPRIPVHWAKSKILEWNVLLRVENSPLGDWKNQGVIFIENWVSKSRDVATSGIYWFFRPSRPIQKQISNVNCPFRSWKLSTHTLIEEIQLVVCVAGIGVWSTRIAIFSSASLYWKDLAKRCSGWFGCVVLRPRKDEVT